MQIATQTSIDIPGIKKLRSGKVREVFDLGGTLLFVVTDRISAFDVILLDPIPHKGAVLNQISAFWFKRFGDVPNHLVTANFEEFPDDLQEFREQLVGRSMIVKKTKPLPVECVVRGYLAGSGWKEYQQSQSVRNQTSSRTKARIAIAGANLYPGDESRRRSCDENIDMKRCAQILVKKSQTA
jgi:phosphoribosylaminoimidazole-succinocarboxamide synthase